MAPKAKPQPKTKAKAKAKAQAKAKAKAKPKALRRFPVRFLQDNRCRIVKVAPDLTAAGFLGIWAECNQEYPGYVLVERQRGAVDVDVCDDSVLSQILERRAMVFVRFDGSRERA